MMFEPNQIVNRLRTRPLRSESGTWAIVRCSISTGASTAARSSDIGTSLLSPHELPPGMPWPGSGRCEGRVWPWRRGPSIVFAAVAHRRARSSRAGDTRPHARGLPGVDRASRSSSAMFSVAPRDPEPETGADGALPRVRPSHGVNRPMSPRTTHRRIRPFNTRETYPEQDLDNDLCQAVVAGDTVYLRGQIGEDLDTNESVGIGDVEAQTERAMANIDMRLREAGSELAHIVKVVVYIVDPRYRETVYRVMGRWLKGVHPVSTGLVVSALARPEWLVEIDATAVIPADA